MSSIAASHTGEFPPITIRVTDASTNTFNLYALSRPWTEGQVTWDQANSSTLWQFGGADGPTDFNPTVLGTVTPSQLGNATITLNAAGISQLQAWISNPASNYGFILKNYADSVLPIG